MNPFLIINELHAEHQTNTAKLEVALAQIRDADEAMASLMDSIKVAERDIDAIEGQAVADATKPDGLINGTNEDKRKPQRNAFLQALRDSDVTLMDLYTAKELMEERVERLQMERRANADQVTILKFQLEHADAMLHAVS